MDFVYSCQIIFIILGSGFNLLLSEPLQLRKCSSSYPDFDECVREGVEEALRKFADGNEELGVSPLDPLHVNSISVARIPTAAVSIDQKFSNIKLHGLSKSTVNKLKVDRNSYGMISEVFTPVLRTEADFELNGQLLVFPINGNGPCNVTMTNLKSYHNLTAKIVKKNGKDHLRFIDYKIVIKPEKIKFDFQNIIKGNPLLSEQMNKVMNDNSISVFEEVRPATEEKYGAVFKKIANQLFAKVPLEEVYIRSNL